MKGIKGPGNQCSSFLYKSLNENKKVKFFLWFLNQKIKNFQQKMETRKSSKQPNAASVWMPDGEVLSIGGSVIQTISTDKDENEGLSIF